MKKIVKLPLLLLSLVCILAALQCKKNKNPNSDNGLPPATQEGKHIFAAFINNEPWISGRGLNNEPIGWFGNDSLWLTGAQYNNPNETLNARFMIGLYQCQLKEGNVYSLNDTLKKWVKISNYSCFSNTGSYGNNSAYATDGELHLTKLDTINHIISGTFWFNIPTQYCNTIHVTDGRFDIKYKY